MSTAAATDTSTRARMTTHSGRSIALLAPLVRDITLEDIAHHLAHVCRWGGAVRTFYSVAQHSLLVANLVPREHVKWALLHDASEAYLGDVVCDLKRLSAMNAYRALEAHWQQVIYHRFHLHGEPPPAVKEADRLASIIEAQDLLPVIPDDFPSAYRDQSVRAAIPRLRPMAPAVAREKFYGVLARVFGDHA